MSGFDKNDNLVYNVHQVLFEWSEEKNKKLQQERNVSFEEVVSLIVIGEFLGPIENPSKNFPKQEVFLVKINNYPCAVPFVRDKNKIFLKTIIPNRKLKKLFKGGGE